jgi:hypothetical protein
MNQDFTFYLNIYIQWGTNNMWLTAVDKYSSFVSRRTTNDTRTTGWPWSERQLRSEQGAMEWAPMHMTELLNRCLYNVWGK